MGLILNGEKLSNIEFIESKDENVFRLSNNEGTNEINFRYIPVLENTFDYKNFNVYIFENNYLNAENDVFQIKDKNIDERLGWIFPVTILESNENDYSENKFLNRYKYVAFRILLESKESDTEIGSLVNDDMLLSQIYGENIQLLVLSKEQTNKVKDFNIDNYLPNLSNYGYYIKNNYPLTINLDTQKKYALNFRSQNSLKISNTNRPISESPFFIQLYIQYLKTLDHHLVRFYLLYQVIEHFIGERFENNFTLLLDDYTGKNIDKNDLFEQMKELKQERSNVKAIFECLKNSSSANDEIITDLERDCRTLLEKYNNKIKGHTGDLVYDIRKLVVHNYRKLKDNEIALLEEITFEFELIITDILKTYCPQKCL